MRSRAAVVTGAAGGIGAAIASRLSQEGFLVGVADVAQEKIEELARELEGIPLQMDVTSVESVEGGFTSFLEVAERLDVLVNCAGVISSTPIEEMLVEEWRRVFDVNVLGTFLCSRAALERLGEGGSIINIGSRTGLVGSSSSGVHYAASKAAIINLTKSFARQSAKRGIRVNVVNPGVIDTLAARHLVIAERQEELRDYSLFSRIGTPEEVSGAVAFLASSDSSYMTGTALNVTGGDPM